MGWRRVLEGASEEGVFSSGFRLSGGCGDDRADEDIPWSPNRQMEECRLIQVGYIGFS